MRNYKEIEKTIEIFRVWDKNKNGYSWRANKGWNSDRKNELIMPYKKNNAKKIGIVLDRFVVFDIDYMHQNNGVNGYNSFKKYLNENFNKDEIKKISNDIKNTMVVHTPKNGLHIWFELPNEIKENDFKRQVNWLKGVDLLTNSKCFAPAPNTEREDGKYLINENSTENISIAPNWVLDILMKNKRPNVSDSRFYSKDKKNSDVENKSIFYNYIEMMKNGFEQGSRDENIYKLSCSVINLVSKNVMSMDIAIFIVETTAKNCSPPFEDWVEKWNSAIKTANENILKNR